MDYINVADEGKRNALNNRITQLEGAHYSNVVYLIEARATNDVGRKTQLLAEQDEIEKALNALYAEFEKVCKNSDDSE